MEELMIIVSLIAIVFAGFQIALMVKLWKMTDDVRQLTVDVRKLYQRLYYDADTPLRIGDVVIRVSDGKEMTVLGVFEKDLLSCRENDRRGDSELYHKKEIKRIDATKE